MKKIIFLLSLGLFSFLLFSGDALANEDDDNFVRMCLKKWPGHPFNAKKLDFRVIKTRVKVLGVGGDINDNEKTSEPELILVKPGVGVLSKTLYNLHNPNGYYCLKGRVSVLGKMEINVACKAKIAATEEDLAVLGSSDQKTGGVSVLGSVRLVRDCGEGESSEKTSKPVKKDPPVKENEKDE